MMVAAPREGEVNTFPGSSFLHLLWGGSPTSLTMNFSALLFPAATASHQVHLHKKCTKW